jgi:hypothetical protein
MELVDERNIPPGNRRGRRQPAPDHPDVPYDVWTAEHGKGLTFPFAFRGLAGAAARLAGCRSTDGVELAHGRLRIRYGPWTLDTDLDNVVDAAQSGPYQLVKVAGPPHLSFADGGITFGTNIEAGVCLRFLRPVPAALPVALLRHPGATVTVRDVDGLVRAVEDLRAAARS